MPPKFKGKQIKKAMKIAGEIRRSQTITTYGSGAVIDLPRMSGILAGIDLWDTKELPDNAKIHERNLERLLNVEYFYQVSSPENPGKNSFGIPIFRFPSWYYCPKCHRLDHYKNLAVKSNGSSGEYNKDLFCNYCSTKTVKVKLVPSRFIVACPNGHIEDFPYTWWVHKGSLNRDCENPDLRFEYSGKTGGLDSIKITCKSCGAHRTMEGCFDKNALASISCRGNMPWLGAAEDGKGWYKDPEGCTYELRVLQRSANNVYYPIKQSALTIPPWSSKIQEAFSERDDVLQFIFDNEDGDKTREEIIRDLKKEFKRNGEIYRTDQASFIKEAFKRYTEAEEEVNIQTLLRDEYRAFIGEDVREDFFRTYSVDVPDDFSELISQIKLVTKLREVMALKGFTRISPPDETEAETVEENEDSGNEKRRYAPLSRKPLKWLPAVEMFGEGIFIELNEKAVEKWEERNRARYVAMSHRYDEKWIGMGKFSAKNPRYVLLHTLSHLLIRQLASQCGYATASIKEKIYSDFDDADTKMCGILIYTSATDTDGSLGGLVREGDTDRIGITLKKMLREASWCSNDPICIDSKNSGYKGLNYAACHACTLLPETSCESVNCLLDRAAVTGTPDEIEIAYFKDLL